MSRKALAGQYMGRANPTHYDTQKAELRSALLFWRSDEEAEDVPVFLARLVICWIRQRWHQQKIAHKCVFIWSLLHRCADEGARGYGIT